MEEGEIATFEAVSAYSERSTQQVTIEKRTLYRYADYNLGTYLTEPYYISYGSVRATAYYYSQQNLDQDLEIIQSQRLGTIRR